MSKEEIFNKQSFHALGAISPSKYFCLDAMDEYAKQEAIAFFEWAELNFEEFDLGVYTKIIETNFAKKENFYNVAQLYNLYLQSKSNKEV